MTIKTRIGFIGAGGNARGHMARVHASELARVAAVCDVVPELAQQSAETYEVPAFSDIDAMLDEVPLDAVVISLPVHAHGTPELKVIERRLPFLVEKPVARDMATAQQVLHLVQEHRIITSVGYQLRYINTARKVREYLRRHPPALVVGSYWSGSGRMEPDAWQVQFAKSGGQILEQATHTLDLMRYMVGEIEEVVAYRARRVLDGTDCPDTHSVSMCFANGALGSLTTFWAMHPSDWRYANTIHITGDAYHLQWSPAGLEVKLGDREVETYPNSEPNLDAVFIDAVRREDPTRICSPYSDGVRSLAVSLAVLESSIGGGTVRLDDML